MTSWVLASHNMGKVVELSELLGHLNLVSLSQFTDEAPEETGLTFVENAIIKARNAAHLSGMPAIADDSGLVVDALDGAPGVISARFAGEEANTKANNTKLLQMMEEVPQSQRTARYVCVMVALKHAEDPLPVISTGLWEGHIHTKSQGDGGFGYDPVFWLDDKACTVAELSSDIKNQMSHRALASRKLKSQLCDH